MSSSSAIEAAKRAGNVNISSQVKMEVMELSAESKATQAQYADAMRKFEVQKRARSVVVPTKEEDVKEKLRLFGHPVTLFGENPADRRMRLQEVVAAMQLDDDGDIQRLQSLLNSRSPRHDGEAGTGTGTGTDNVGNTGKTQDTVFSRASTELLDVRKELCDASFARARDRLTLAKMASEDDASLLKESLEVQILYEHSRDLLLDMSEFAFRRPLLCARYSNTGDMVATGSMTENVKLWDVQTLKSVGELIGHRERVTNLDFASKVASPGKNLLATSSADSSIRVWDLENIESKKLNTSMELCGHRGVVQNLSWHPYRALLGSAGHDRSWRLWDVNTSTELLHQDGIARECSVVCFHPDGGLVLTGDWAGVALLWDLRSGLRLHAFQGHGRKLVRGSFSPDGWRAATCSTDNTVHIWDLRNRSKAYALPAHAAPVTDVRFSASGELLLTSSFDGTLRLWGTRDWRLIASLSGHTGKVMATDFHPDERHLLSGGFDRTVKLWSHKSAV
jgi:U4/U6 small nuclear ribonucleoprotein PRP4